MSKERLEEIKWVIRSWLAWDVWNDKQRDVLNDILAYMEQLDKQNQKYHKGLKEIAEGVGPPEIIALVALEVDPDD